jgi:Family of unknown function (DUF6152)
MAVEKRLRFSRLQRQPTGVFMQRRHFIVTGSAALVPLFARAHHGWSSFDQDKPIYLEGKAESVAWRNPHAELKLRLAPNLRVPADLASRKMPAQSASVDAAKILAAARVPTRKDTLWDVELAPLTRMQAWQVAEIKPGQDVSVVGFTFTGEKGDPILRAEFLFVDGKAYGLRSSPA